MDKHWIVSRTPRARIEEFDSYDRAVMAYTEAQRQDPEQSQLLAIRSAADPQWAHAPMVKHGDPLSRLVYVSNREAVRKEIGSTARAMIVGHASESFAAIERHTLESLKARNIDVDRWQVQDAVKSRVILGRCKQHGGFWMPKKDGPLHKQRCPICSGYLNQTSLALRSGFASLHREGVSA